MRVRPELIVNVPMNVERTFDDFMAGERPILSRDFHSSRIMHGTSGAGMVVPHGNAEGIVHEERERYLQAVAAAVDHALPPFQGPLILTGTDQVVHRLRSFLKYTNVFLSPVQLPVPEVDEAKREARGLWQQCVELIRQIQGNPEQRAALGEYKALRGTGRTSEDHAEIQRLAEQGKIGTLLYSDALLADQVAEEDMLTANRALIATIQHRGKAYLLADKQLDGAMAAILRPGTYSVPMIDAQQFA
jgi:hypothetical protein